MNRTLNGISCLVCILGETKKNEGKGINLDANLDFRALALCSNSELIQNKG